MYRMPLIKILGPPVAWLPGLYYYEVKINQEQLSCKGWVQVIR